MSKLASQRGSFMHIFRRYGPESVQKHSYPDILLKTAAKATEWFSITKDLAEMLVYIPSVQQYLMCYEVEDPADNNGEEFITQVSADDLVDGHFPKHWKTFVIAIYNP